MAFHTLSRDLPQIPPVFDATPKSLLGDARSLVERTQKVWEDIVKEVTTESATFENAIKPSIDDENSRLNSIRILKFYASTSPSRALRDASSAIGTIFTDSEVDLFSRTDIFALVNAVVIRESKGNVLDAESRNYLEKLHLKFKQNGCGITDPTLKLRFAECQKRLKDLERQCNQNLHEEKAGLWLTHEELEGVPSSLMSRYKQGEGEFDGYFWVATKVPQSSPVMKHATKENTRKKMLYAIQNRMPENVTLFKELVLLRDETARILGYPNHAALKMANKMVKQPEIVESFLSEIRTRLIPRGAAYAGELLDLKRKDIATQGTASDQIYLWDQSYYAHLLDETQETPDTAVSEYFELFTTLRKLLQMFEHLFATRFELITQENQYELGNGKPLIWHEDVLMFGVFNSESEDFMGYAYFDFYPREGKYTHVGHYSLQPNFLQQDGSRHYASSVLVMNYSNVTDHPTLLNLQEVGKLFHEIGHLIHALCTETRYAASQYVDRDFVEAPSLMFEQFFWQKDHIKDVSFHYSHISSQYKQVWEASLTHKQKQCADSIQPEAQLQDDVVALLEKQSTNWKGLREQLKDVFFSTFDMLVHNPKSHEALKALNLAENFNRLKTEIYNLAGGEAVGDGWEWGHGEAVFRNIINNYDAGYYGYVLGRVFALDIFDAGFNHDTMSKESGRRYRDIVLRPGGSQPEMKTLTDYLGRQPSTKPYFKYLGIETGDDERSTM